MNRIRQTWLFYQGPRFRARDIVPTLAFIVTGSCHPWQDYRRGSRAWWLLRGISSPLAYRALCRRCGRTGQAHEPTSSLAVCRRFLP